MSWSNKLSKLDLFAASPRDEADLTGARWQKDEWAAATNSWVPRQPLKTHGKPERMCTQPTQAVEEVEEGKKKTWHLLQGICWQEWSTMLINVFKSEERTILTSYYKKEKKCCVNQRVHHACRPQWHQTCRTDSAHLIFSKPCDSHRYVRQSAACSL